MTKHALLLIDIQNDFCAGGALEVAEGDDVVEVANAMVNWCKTRGDVVLASQDWHPANHGSFAGQHAARRALLGPECLTGKRRRATSPW